MSISVFDLFSIGIGPSSSHTVGPMRAARRFLLLLQENGHFDSTHRVRTDLYGSLALTGKGHGTDWAILLGLEGETPEGIDPNSVQIRWEHILSSKKLNLFGTRIIPFHEPTDFFFHYTEMLPFHPNAIRFTAYGKDDQPLFERVIYSVGGGFIVEEETLQNEPDAHLGDHGPKVPYPFSTGDELLELAQKHGMTIPQLMMENEKVWRCETDIKNGILNIWRVMKESTQRGCEQEGILPGGLKVRRRAKTILESLQKPNRAEQPADMLEWVSLWALAVNEENAAGSRVVTAPTNGSAGVIPAVLHYYDRFVENASDDGIIDFFLTAGAIGILYKIGASISAAEMGCMGEVGVACSMAAAGLTTVLGGTSEQIENAAEIGMEHNLGLTCDPIKGLVQIPCIERNTMGAIKAINAALLALRGDGKHRVSLDQVIATMRETGKNMQSIYKETSLGGLAVNVPEC